MSVAVHRSSNGTCLWQAILWTNGYLLKSQIDGIFGDRAAAADGVSHTVDTSG